MSLDIRRLLKRAAIGWWNDNAISLGAAISYFTVFSLAPVLLAAISVAGFLFGREAARGAVVGELGGMLGNESATAIETMIASADDFGPGVVATLVGAVTFLILATGVFMELRNALNQIWKVQPSNPGIVGFLRTRLISLALVLGIGFLLLVSLVIDAAVTATGTYLESNLSEGFAVLGFLNNVVGLLIAILLFAMIYKILPAARLAWRDVWIGAIVTGLLFTLGKFLIGFYIGRSGIASSYGAAASIITILLWIYYSCLILLFGAEFTKAYAETYGSRARSQA